MRRLVLLFAFFLLLGLSAFAQSPLSYKSVVIFGDSFVDNGNVYNSAGTVPVTDADGNIYYVSALAGLDYATGRFTDGLNTTPAAQAYINLWHEQLTVLLPGVPLTSPYVGRFGANFAWAGATSQSGTTSRSFGSVSVMVHNMGQQVTDYLNSGATPDGNTLFILNGGVRDLLDDSSAANVTVAAQRMTALVQQLAAAGAVNIFVANIPPVSSNLQSPIDVAAASYRTQLAVDLNGLQQQLALNGKPIRLTQFDLYALYANIYAAPASFGFTDVSTPAQSLGYGRNPDTYLSWDGNNPTTAGHYQIAQAACTALTQTRTTLTVDNIVATPTRPSTLTATVSTAGTYAVPSTAIPGGTVSFYNDATILGQLQHTLLGTAPVGANGKATLTVTSLPDGAYTLSAIYSGDANFPTGCRSNEQALSIAQTDPGFVISYYNNRPYGDLFEGATTQVYAQPVNGFTGTVTFACGAIPAPFQCNWTNPTVTVGSGGTQYAQLAITSTQTVTVSGLDKQIPLGKASALLLSVVFLVPLFVALRRRRGAQTLLALMLLAGTLGVSSCAGNMALPGPTKPPTTTRQYYPPGTYSVPIIATSNGVATTSTYTFYIANGF